MTPEEIAKMQADLKTAQDEAAALKKEKEDEKARLQKEADDKKKNEGEDLLAKAKREQKEKEDAQKGDKSLENALQFNLTVSEFIKQNKDLIPDSFEKVLELANKETYDTPKHKANAIRSGLIQSFFSVQDHVNLLTDNQKKNLADFMKLTKTGKEEQSHTIYENVFESAFEMLKHVKKAEDKAKAKASEGTNDSSYKDRLMKGSQNKFFGKKS